jgi:hypothetical protein
MSASAVITAPPVINAPAVMVAADPTSALALIPPRTPRSSDAPGIIPINPPPPPPSPDAPRFLQFFEDAPLRFERFAGILVCLGKQLTRLSSPSSAVVGDLAGKTRRRTATAVNADGDAPDTRLDFFSNATQRPFVDGYL